MPPVKIVNLVFVAIVGIVVVAGQSRPSDWSWSQLQPEDCPYQNNVTHVCSRLFVLNGVCTSAKCCRNATSDRDYDGEDEADYDHEEESPSDDVVHHDDPKSCTSRCVSVSIRSCSRYLCVESCCDGYERDMYNRCIKKTNRIQCENGGTAYKTFYSWKCRCPWNYTGSHCEIAACRCENGGTCKMSFREPVCECPTGYYGKYCEMKRCSLACQNGGTCYFSNCDDGVSNEFCKCLDGFVGPTCAQKYINSHFCPATDRNLDNVRCVKDCTEDDSCPGNEVCCNEGCSLVCRKPVSTCTSPDGRTVAVGGQYKNSECETCICGGSSRPVCWTKSCQTPKCRYGQKPVKRPGQCCEVCEVKKTNRIQCENGGTAYKTFYGWKCRCPWNYTGSHCEIVTENSPLVMRGCSTSIKTVNTDTNSDNAIFTSRNTDLTAVDLATGRLRQPVFSPRSAMHCRCSDFYQRAIPVSATFTSSSGDKAVCNFYVVIKDTEPPRPVSCPRDIYAFDDEYVQWRPPVFVDNVLLSSVTSTHPASVPIKYHADTKFTVVYKARDIGMNMASCTFTVQVCSRDASISDLPAGLRQRSTSNNWWIVVPAIGAYATVVLTFVLIHCRRRMRSLRHAQRRSQRQPTRAFENIYVVSDNATVKLPRYLDIPFNPPPYTVSGKMKDATYTTLPPPPYKYSDVASVVTKASGSYANPKYGTISSKLRWINM